MLEKLLPGWSDRTVKYYYLTEAAMNLWFIAPVWFFIFRHFVSVKEIGINEIVVFAIGLMAEVPSGALADSIGRRKTLILGGILLLLGTIATLFAVDLMSLIIGQSIWFIGYAFYSGANEALVYDRLVAEKKEHLWAKISARKNSLVVLVTMISVLLGGYMYAYQYRLPFLVHAGAMLLFLLFVLRYPKDTTLRVINTSVHTFGEYKKNLVIGVRELLRPKLRFLLWGVVVSATMYYAYEWGVLRPMILENQGYDGFMASVLSFILHIVEFFLFLMLPKIFGNKASEKKVLIAVILGAICFTLLALPGTVFVVGSLIIMYTVIQSILKWWTSIYVNEHVSSAYRATALSTWAMLEKVPYIFLVGIITNFSGQAFSVFIFITGIVIGLFGLGTLVLLKKVDPTLRK